MTLFFLSLNLLAAGHRFVVIPVEFSDVSFTDIHSSVNDKVNTAREYFNEQFSPSLSFTFDILPIVRVSKPYAWYGANSSTRKDARIGELVREAVNGSAASFSVYDNDSDGTIDNIYIITAGHNEAYGMGADWIWPQQSKLSEHGESFQVSGKTVDCIAVCTEDSPASIFCHELGHVFGLQDMYDTDGNGSGGLSQGLWGKLSPMDLSSSDGSLDLPPNFSAIELEQLGIGKKITYFQGPCHLRPLSQSKEYLRIDTDTDGEYYLLECRKPEGWDAGLGGGGLVIYHIDRSDSDSWYSDLYSRNLSAQERWRYNQVNCRPDRQCAQVISAIPGTNDLAKVFFPQGTRRTFCSDTDPSFRFWNGNTSNVAIDRISMEADGSVSFNIVSPVSILATHVFQDAIIINWQTAEALNVKDCYVSWYLSDVKGGSMKGSSVSHVQANNMFYTIIEGLDPSTDYSIRIRAISETGQAFSSIVRLSTKGRQKGVRPFIYLNSLSRREDGSFFVGDRVPMRVYNLENVGQVLWYFNGVRMRPESDGYWHLTQSGTLKVEIWYKDGSKEIITKEMKVR